MTKRHLLLLIIFFIAHSAWSQIGYTPYGFGYMGGQKVITIKGKKVSVTYSTGQIAPSGRYKKIALDEVHLNTGMLPDVAFYPTVFDKDLFASKGYFPEYVRLEWSITALEGRIKKIHIFRKVLGDEGDSIVVGVLGPDAYSWQDQYADKGVLYKYTVFAEGISDDLRLPYINVVESTGFALPAGTVSGRITFEGGTAVEGVKIMAESGGSLRGKSIYVNGEDAFITIPHEAKDAELELSGGFTFQTWMKFEGDKKGAIFTKGQNYELYYDPQNGSTPGSLTFRVSNATVALPFNSPVDSFFHVTAIYEPGKKIKLYAHVTDERVDSAVVSAGSQPVAGVDNIYIGRNKEGNFVKGNFSEIRLWNKALTYKEIKRDFNRYIAGTEKGLSGYWRITAGFGNRIYDCARKGYTFYENHGILQRSAWSEKAPFESQLAYKGITDAQGNYTISGFPYQTEGSLYTFTPMLGVHTFEPKQHLRFIGDGESIHNGLDFKDVSSFKVSGTVKYNHTKFPVEGVAILIDGRAAVNKEGVLITTDNLGRFTVDVPIGLHSIRMSKTQHGFAKEGRFPQPNGIDEIPTYNFQSPISGLEFTDTTLVKVAGRVVGGPIQAEKPLGFKKSKNNIGNATIYITSEKGYDLTLKDSTKTYNEEYFSNSAQFSTKFVTVSPNVESGEFVTYLPPEKYKVTGVTAGNYTFDENSHITMSLLSSSWAKELMKDTLGLTVKGVKSPKYPPFNPSKYDSVYTSVRPDSLWTIGVDTFKLQKRQDFIYRKIPTITVLNGKGGTVFGDTTFTYVNKLNNTQTPINLVVNGAYTFGYPVFTQRQPYSMIIRLQEEYENINTGVLDKVPVVDGKLEIANDLSLDKGKVTVALDSKGKAIYNFKGGTPETNLDPVTPANSFTKTLNITAFSGEEGAIKTIWRDGNPFRGFVFGGLPTGNNFVTTGPSEMDMILRDPPGSNSAASLIQGTTTSKSSTYSVTSSSITETNMNIQLGGTIETFAGIGAGVITEVEVASNTDIGLKTEKNWVDNNTTVNTTTSTRTWSTSASPNFVGAMGDVFIGHATNIVYGKSLFIELLPQSICTTCGPTAYSGYKIGLSTGLRVNPEFATSFIFTQSYIESTLIPNLKQLRNANLVYADPNSVHPTTKPLYVSKVPPTDPKFGSQNTDQEVWGNLASKFASEGPSYSMKVPVGYTKPINDTVLYMNQQVNDWKFWLSENERFKAKAKLTENLSFDAGSNYQQSVETTVEETSHHDYTMSIDASLATELGFSVNENGFSESIGFSSSTGVTRSTGGTTSKSTTFGFTLADENPGNYYSVDVKDGKDGFGPVFAVKGGVSSCPYEGEYKSRYYEPGKYVLSEAMVKAESPEISINQTVVADVPEIRPATFTLTLKNNSQANYDIWYRVILDETTNPYGAEVGIDNNPISDGRLFLVPAGKVLQKTMTVRKGAGPEYSYENLRVVVHSTCQFDPLDGLEDISDTVQFSAYFQPACSDIDISMPKDQWVMNTNINPKDTMTVKIGKYDVNFGSFHHVAFQYKPKSSSEWTTDMIFYNKKAVTAADYEKLDQPKAWIDGPQITYLWDMHSLPDREYDIRAKSVCVLGPGINIETPSYIISGLKDVKRPKLFGSPQPADGVLSAGDEIMVQFDETIEAGLLTPFNFSVQGVLNSYPINHNTSITMDGVNDYIKVPDGLDLTGSYTIEFWLKRNVIGKESVIFSKGFVGTDALEIGFTDKNQLYVDISGQRVKTSKTFNSTDWNHYAIVYNKGTKELSAYRNDAYILERVIVVNKFSGTGAINIGRSVITNDKFSNANIHDLRVWSKPLQIGQVYAQMQNALSGSEIGLVGYWPMDEAFGNKATDKARYRHALLFADWLVVPKGKTIQFDGVDDFAEINTGSTVVISEEMDMSVEFWFKAEPGQTNTTMFSSGKGDGTDHFNGNNLSIGFNGAGAIYVMSNGQLVEMNSESGDYRDSNWHHFTMALDRKGNVNLYLDGVQKISRSASGFGGLSGSRMWVGARGYKSGSITTEHDQYFAGLIDELRIWKLMRKQKQIELDRNAKLKGTEMGLVAYYPFEYYTTNSGIKLIEATLKDQWQNKYGANGGAATVSGGATFSDDAPNMKDARPVTKVDFDWAVNGDKIIITTSPAMKAVIEKSLLEITVSDIEDKHENRLASPISWSAFIDKNQLKWGEDLLTFDKKLYEPYTFMVDIVNHGGTEQNYSLKNIPAWLTVSPEEGILAPLSTQKIEFTINKGINTGYFSEDLFLSGDFGFDEKLHIDMRVFAEEPKWEVDASKFQYSMDVIGKVEIDGILSSDAHDKVGAFVNGECRGVAYLKYIKQFDMYQVYMDIYSNKVSGDTIELRVWDASRGTEHRDVKPQYTFAANVIHGSPSKPELIKAGTTYVQKFNFEKGWNWVSFNLSSPQLSNISDLMKGISSAQGDQMKGQSQVDVFANGIGWSGSLTTSGGIKNGKMYMAKVQNGGQIEIVGKQVDSEFPINITNGWNWIGYIPRFNMSVNEALANLNSANGDIIKGKRAFATYQEGMGWIGSLEFLVPGEGYLFKSENPETLIYPATSSLSKQRIVKLQEEKSPWPIHHGLYQQNMTMIATIEDGLPNDMVVGAFYGEDCHGFATPVKVDGKMMYFITIHGESSIEVKFKGFSTSENKQYDFAQKTSFGNNLTLGKLDNPIVLSILNGREEELKSEEFKAYPNPFTGHITMELPAAEGGYHIQITDPSGREITNIRVAEANERIYVNWNGQNAENRAVQSGLYLIHAVSGNFIKTFKVIKK